MYKILMIVTDARCLHSVYLLNCFENFIFHYLSGDYQYPNPPDYDGTKEPLKSDCTMEEGRGTNMPLHRFELRGIFDQAVMDTYTDRTKPFSIGSGYDILRTLISDLEINADDVVKGEV